jgi:hypothetical protein
MKRHTNAQLEGLLRLVNSVPADIDLPDPRGREAEVISLLKSEAFEEYRRLKGAIRRERWPAFLRVIAPLSFSRVLQDYETLRLGRAWLRNAAAVGENISRRPDQRFKWAMPPLPQPHVSMHTDEIGRMHFSSHPLVAALEGVSALAIRCCADCQKLFVARRKDQPCCTPRCSHRRRTRRWRARYPEYKLSRIAKSEGK